MNSSPKTVTEKLEEHHIGLTKPELLAALKSGEDEVRGLAATRLADEHSTDAIPQILESMSVEKNPATRINIAYALSRLGETRGSVTLKEACQQPTLPGYVRVRAASYLLAEQDDSCLGSVETLLQLRSDPDTRVQALSILPQYQLLSGHLSEKTKHLVIESLADADPSVRIVASETLVSLGNSSDIPNLEHAITSERDGTVRSAMESALRLIEKKGQKSDFSE